MKTIAFNIPKSTKKNILIFLLIIAASFQSFAEEGEDKDTENLENEIATDEITIDEIATDEIATNENYPVLKDIEGELSLLQIQITPLNAQVKILGDRLSELRKSPEPQDDLPYDMMLTDMERKNADLQIQITFLTRRVTLLKNMLSELRMVSQTRDLPHTAPFSIGQSKLDNYFSIFLFSVFVLLIIIAILACYLNIRNKQRDKTRKTEDERKSEISKDPPLGTRSPNASLSKQASVNTERSSGSSTRRQVPEESKPKPSPDDKITPLYHSGEERTKRRENASGDIFLDIPKSVYERMFRNETVEPVFAKKGDRLSAMFVLADDQDLYLNFHKYNEEYKLPDDNKEILSMIYNIEGILPGNIKSCSPATVLPDGDGCYILSFPWKRVKLEME
jgi:hypothetical protein